MDNTIIKNIIDKILAMILILALIPVILLIALLIKIDSRGPIIFTQQRLGKGGIPFKIYKFRTMTNCNQINTAQTYCNSKGVTFVGKILRRYKIDEIAQIYNILRGDMSFVGPRPDLPEHITNYTDLAFERLKVKPGMTGLAQINGNIYLTWEERWKYDSEYVRRINCLLDIKIIFKTIKIVLRGEEKYIRSNDV